MAVNPTIGTRIRAFREKRGLKQHDIANALQVSPQAVSKWERGENAPDIALLVPLATLLGVSTDTLLGCHEGQLDVFDATVFFSNVEGYAKKSRAISPRSLATWANGFFFQLTEAILHYDGIPVKYMGDGFVGFFSGANHQRRAVQAAFHAREVLTEKLIVALHSGSIYLGTIGYPDYSRPDIMGDAVNLAFITMEWAARHTRSAIVATESVMQSVERDVEIGSRNAVKFDGFDEAATIYELCSAAS